MIPRPIRRSLVSFRIALFAAAGLLPAIGAHAAAGDDAPAPNRAAWMRTAKWGIMNHYLADWISRANKIDMTVEKWNDLVDHFDVEALAEQVQSVGAGWYQI